MTRFRDKPAEAQWLTPYLIVSVIKQSLKYYERALGLKPGHVLDGPDGKPMHAELMHKGRLVLMMAPEGAFGSTAKCPKSGGYESPLSLYLYVDDVDACFEAAKAAGAAVEREPEDQFWGDRMASIKDPDGYSVAIASNFGEFDPDKVPS